MQLELEELQRRARLSPWRVQRAGIVSSLGCSWVWALIFGLLVQLIPSLHEKPNLWIAFVAIAGAVAFLILMLSIRFKHYPAIVGRQSKLVQQLRQLLFEQGIFSEFLNSAEKLETQTEESSAALIKSLLELALPFQTKGLLSRFESFATSRALQLPEFARYRGGTDELELRCALQLAIVEELRNASFNDTTNQ